MSRLNELELKNDIVGGERDLDSLPEQYGQFTDPVQPGSYRVQFPQPGPLSESWDVFDTKKGQRLVAKLQGDAALTIVQSPLGKLNGEPLETRISNAERKRGKGDDAPEASDMDYALKATKYAGKIPPFGANRQYAEAFLSVAGKQCGIDWEFSWFCNETKPIRVEDPVNGTVVMDGKDGRQDVKGCGTRYYQNLVDKVPDEKGESMVYPVRITCQCGAQLRAFGQIARFRE